MLNNSVSNFIDNLSRKVEHLSNQLSNNGKKYYKSILHKGKKINNLGKIQLEIEKLKWELKHRYKELGKYVAEKKISKSVTDFSHDQQFLELVNEVNKINLYINDLQSER